MAILKIARMGHPVLLSPAKPVGDPHDPEIRRLVGDMIETMLDADGVGLAAPQVHAGLRVIVFRVPPERTEPEESEAPEGISIVINPQVMPLGPEQALGWEGCLSIPGLRGAVPRYTRIRYRGIGLDGEPLEREAQGFHARVVQHECDHLDGILYPMRMTDLSLFGFVEEFRRGLPPLEDRE